MKPQDEYRNGDGGAAVGGRGGGGRAGSASPSEDSSSGSEGGSGGGGGGAGGEGGAEDLSLRDEGAPARALAALNALRKSRQHFDVVLVAEGAEVPAHRAVLAAASPYLLEALQAPEAAHRVEGVSAEALRALVEYAYTGRLGVGGAGEARRLYRAAWRLRVEPVRAHLAERLLRRAAPADCLQLRALPDLAPHQLRDLDDYIARNFDEICESGALATLPVICIEMLRESSAEDGGEAPVAVAGAALAWLRDRHAADVDLEELCSRTHLLFVDARGELRDCGELPASQDEAPALGEYRREARERERGARRRDKDRESAPVAPRKLALGDRAPRPAAADDCSVLAARAGGGGVTRALVCVRGRLAAARVSWRRGGAGAGVARGGVLGGARDSTDGARRAPLTQPRCAHGTAVLDGRIVVCGGYDRARVLRSAEAYEPAANTWAALSDMRTARARFPAARLGGALYALGGSDGHADLDSVDALMLESGAWKSRARLPLARSHAAAAADEARGVLYVVGGWAAGVGLRRVDRYNPEQDAWEAAPPLEAARSQCACVCWAGALWALGGCDTWHCLASTELLPLDRPGPAAAWTPGPPLPTARRSMGGAEWRGRLVACGGSDGAASLRRVDWLAAGGAAGAEGGGGGAGGGEGGWRPLPDLRRPRAGLGLAVLDAALFAVGGFDGKEFLSCVECLYEPDGEWTTLCAPPRPAHTPAPHTPPPGTLDTTPDQHDTKENGSERAVSAQ